MSLSCKMASLFPRPSPICSPGNIIKILISTDNHVGYLESDPIRGMDSFLAFEEVLRQARDREVRWERGQE